MREDNHISPVLYYNKTTGNTWAASTDSLKVPDFRLVYTVSKFDGVFIEKLSPVSNVLARIIRNAPAGEGDRNLEIVAIQLEAGLPQPRKAF